MTDFDRETLDWVRKFNPYDLYTKTGARPDVNGLLPYYRKLVAEFLPATLAW